MLHDLFVEKLLKEYDFLSSDLKYKKAVIDQFLPTLRKVESLNESNQLIKREEIIENIKRIPSEIEKQIYRQISKLTHPDKNLDQVDNFKEAAIAYSSGNFIQLMKIAKNLEIKFQIDAQTLNKIENEISDLKLQNSILEQHLIWKWYLTTDDVERDVLEQHIRSL